MQFTFETHYNRQTLSLMSKVMRKTVRKKHSRAFSLFGWFAIVCGVLMIWAGAGSFGLKHILTAAAVILILMTRLFEDNINGFFAEKHLLPGTERAVTTFSESGFVTITDISRSEWNYDKICAVAECDDFFVFIFSRNHAQLYDKRSLKGGSAEDFRGFIQAASGKAVERVQAIF